MNCPASIGQFAVVLVGANFLEIFSRAEESNPASDEAISAVMLACLCGNADEGRGKVFRLANGRDLAVDYSLSPTVENGVVTGAVLLFSDAAHDVARFQGWGQLGLDIGLEYLPVHRTIDDKRSHQAIMTQPGDECLRLPMSEGHRGFDRRQDQ